MTIIGYIATITGLFLSVGTVVFKLNDLIKSNKMRIEILEKSHVKLENELDKVKDELNMLAEIKMSLEVLRKSFEINMEFIKKELSRNS
jgi:hypothetical protein